MDLNSWSCGECAHEGVCKYKDGIGNMFITKEAVIKGNAIKVEMKIECNEHVEAE